MTDFKKISELPEATTFAATDLACLVSGGDTKKILLSNLFNLPYGAFSSNATQTCTAGTTADAITYTDTDASDGVTLSDSSHINIATAGTYLITFSAVTKSTAPNIYLDIWLAIDGTPVVRSNTRSRFVGSANERIITVTYIVPFTAGQYFQLFMWSDSSGTNLQATGTLTNPTRPACPSIIVTANMISY